MRRAHFVEDIKPISQFRANAADLIRHVRESKRPLVLTHRGQSAAVVLDVREYESLVEELETLRDIHVAEKQIVAGKGVPNEKARKHVLKSLAGR